MSAARRAFGFDRGGTAAAVARHVAAPAAPLGRWCRRRWAAAAAWLGMSGAPARVGPSTAASDVLAATLARCRRAFLFVGLFSCCINLLMLTVPLFMLQLYDRVLPGRSRETLIFLILIALAAVLALGLLEVVRSRILVRVSVWIDQVLGPRVFERSVSASLHAPVSSGDHLHNLSRLRSFLGGSTVFALFDAPWTPIYLGVIWLLHPLIGVIAVLGSAALLGLAVLNEAATRRLLGAANEVAGRSMRRAEATGRNAEVIAAMGMMPHVAARWSAENQRVVAGQMAASDRAGVVVAASKVLRLTLQIAVLGAGGFLVLDHQLTGGAMIAASILTSRALAPVEQSIGTWKQVVTARGAYTQLQQLFRRWPAPPPGLRLPAPRADLAVERVAFTYPGAGEPTLRGVSFELQPGEALAVVGPSAAGKSTLARLVIGVWRPDSGAVRLDGVDVATWDRQDLGRHVGYLPQDVELFAGTVADNIARMGRAPAGEVVRAAQVAGVHRAILRLPRGYDTELADGGAPLSGGLRQRVGLARALFGRPRLLVLDEPNSNLDEEGEHALTSAVQLMKRAGSTVVIIAHRPSVLAHTDRILVLRAGTVGAFGSRREVMQLIGRPRAVAPQTVAGPGTPAAIEGGRKA